MKRSIKKIIKQLLNILLSGVIYSVALKYFILPTGVILTGFEGVAVSISYFFDDVSLFKVLYLVFQSLLIIFAFLKVSRLFALRTSLLVLTVFGLLWALPPLSIVLAANDKILWVIFGGLLSGTAKAIALKSKGSTGDEDILGAYFAQKFLKPVGYINIMAGVLSTTFGATLMMIKTLSLEEVLTSVMYTTVYIFISAETLNLLFKKYQLTQLVIITPNPTLITRRLKSMSEHKTYTLEQGVGGYSNQTQSILSMIMPSEEIKSTMALIQHEDPKCFMYYHDLNGLSGRIHIDPIG